MPVIALLKAQALKGQIPKRFAHDAAQARRVAWRIQKQWMEAQLALLQLGAVKIEQIMLPYAILPSTGRSVYEMFSEQQFDRLALPPANKP